MNGSVPPYLLLKLAVYATLCIVGRPKRIHDPGLTANVHARLKETGTSLRKLAVEVHFDPATISRSLSTAAFTPSIRGRLETWLSGADGTSDTLIVLHQALQELAMERKVRAKLEAALKLALDRLGDAG